MSVAGRNAPLSPISIGGSEWSFSSKALFGEEGGPFPPSARGNLVSPPDSGSLHGTMSMNGFPSAPRSTGRPSPPPSVGRSSNCTNTFSGRSDGGNRNSTRTDIDESILNEHYLALRVYLNARDSNGRQQPNKARDKLLRLSSVQFFELSTDVFDELMRRQAAARAASNGPNAPSSFLRPEKSFHPKRNQARQRLSSLGPPRFRDLAADVFHELERRFPRFIGGDAPRSGSAMSMRGTPGSRNDTPVSGTMLPPRAPSRIRRPSDASSMRGLPPADGYPGQPSPSVANGDYGRPTPKQLNQSNTIVPNKSTMVEEGDDNGADDDGADAFGLDGKTNTRDMKRSGDSTVTSEADQKAIVEYQTQIQELREKLDSMEESLRQKDDELNSVLDGERSRATAINVEKKEWADSRLKLETQLAEAQDVNQSLEKELRRMREDQDGELRQLRDQVATLKQTARSGGGRLEEDSGEVQRENDELRESLRQQRQVTEQVRREAQECLLEMRALSQQSGSAYEKQGEMEKNIQQLEREVREWRSRYTRTKTQLRSMRGSSAGLEVDQDAAKYVRDKGFLDNNGLVKDIHVTKFQTAIDELLQRARREGPEKVMDAMKLVVVSVRRITRDVDESGPQDGDFAQQHAKLKAKVSSSANGLITASKNFAAAAGISPVSLVDAAASNLTAAIVDLMRAAKIRTTPASELEEDDDGTATPVESASYFSPRSTRQAVAQDKLPPPPPFRGMGGIRASAESSAYSPVSSPRESAEPYVGNGTNGMTNGLGYLGLDTSLSGPYGMQRRDSRTEDLKMYLEDQTALLVSDIQKLVVAVRGDADIEQISAQVESIGVVVGRIASESKSNGYGNQVSRLSECRQRLIEANLRGRELSRSGVVPGDGDWRLWSQTLPPIAFELAREAKDLVQRIDGQATMVNADDEFS